MKPLPLKLSRGLNAREPSSPRRSGIYTAASGGDSKPPIPLKVGNGLNDTREHWRAKTERVRRHHAAVKAAWGRSLREDAALLAGDGQLVVTLTRLYGYKCRAYDTDNVAGGMKAIRDAVAECLGVDDRDARVRWEYRQRRSDDGQHWVACEVRPLAPGQCPTCGHVEVAHG